MLQIINSNFFPSHSSSPINSTTTASYTTTNLFNRMPLPNWRISYDGLTGIKFIGKLFKRITFNHAYRSNLNVAGFTTNLNYDENNTSVDLNGNVIKIWNSVREIKEKLKIFRKK